MKQPTAMCVCNLMKRIIVRPEVSAMILAKIKRDAEAYLGETDHAGGDHCSCVFQ